MDWQPIALGALGLLYAGLLWEVRQLRKAKHEHAQRLTEALMRIGVLERMVEMIDQDER